MINAREARRRIVRRCGYRITRRQPGVRGQAMEEALAVMKSMGFHPNVVIDDLSLGEPDFRIKHLVQVRNLELAVFND